MRRRDDGERGQSAVEMALIMLPLLMLTAGLVDAGRVFYQYNAVSAAARYAARWAAVEGGTCATDAAVQLATSTSDWCHQVGGSTQLFWQQSGNAPGQGTDATCPTTLPGSSVVPAGINTGAYYNVSQFAPPNASTSTTVVGSLAQHFDTNSSSSNFVLGALTPGFDLKQMYTCIQLIRSSTGATASQIHFLHAGDRIRVYVYYRFSAVSTLLPTQNFPPIVAEAEFSVA
jgi:Flp pilus assembly protein TadG